MKLLSSLIPLAHGWSKCTQLCGGGTSTLANCTGDQCSKNCNLEPCSVYADSIFTDTHMHDPSNWSCNGGCDINQIDGYIGKGITVSARNNNYNGPSQTVDGSTLTASAYKGKVFVKSSTAQEFEMMIKWTKKSDGSNKYQWTGSLTVRVSIEYIVYTEKIDFSLTTGKTS